MKADKINPNIIIIIESATFYNSTGLMLLTWMKN